MEWINNMRCNNYLLINYNLLNNLKFEKFLNFQCHLWYILIQKIFEFSILKLFSFKILNTFRIKIKIQKFFKYMFKADKWNHYKFNY